MRADGSQGAAVWCALRPSFCLADAIATNVTTLTSGQPTTSANLSRGLAPAPSTRMAKSLRAFYYLRSMKLMGRGDALRWHS